MDNHRKMVEKDLAKLGDETPTFSSRLDKKKKYDGMLLTNICNKNTLESNDVAKDTMSEIGTGETSHEVDKSKKSNSQSDADGETEEEKKDTNAQKEKLTNATKIGGLFQHDGDQWTKYVSSTDDKYCLGDQMQPFDEDHKLSTEYPRKTITRIFLEDTFDSSINTDPDSSLVHGNDQSLGKCNEEDLDEKCSEGEAEEEKKGRSCVPKRPCSAATLEIVNKPYISRLGPLNSKAATSRIVIEEEGSNSSFLHGNESKKEESGEKSSEGKPEENKMARRCLFKRPYQGSASLELFRKSDTATSRNLIEEDDSELSFVYGSDQKTKSIRDDSDRTFDSRDLDDFDSYVSDEESGKDTRILNVSSDEDIDDDESVGSKSMDLASGESEDEMRKKIDEVIAAQGTGSPPCKKAKDEEEEA